MHLTKNEIRFKEKAIKIINNNEIEEAVRKISRLTFENKKVGMKRSKNICKLYIRENVTFIDQPDDFHYNKELDDTLCRIKKMK